MRAVVFQFHWNISPQPSTAEGDAPAARNSPHTVVLTVSRSGTWSEGSTSLASGAACRLVQNVVMACGDSAATSPIRSRNSTELIHTETPSEFSGLGIATELAHGTFDLIRESGRKAVLKCPFMVHFYLRHPEYADIVTR